MRKSRIQADLHDPGSSPAGSLLGQWRALCLVGATQQVPVSLDVSLNPLHHFRAFDLARVACTEKHQPVSLGDTSCLHGTGNYFSLKVDQVSGGLSLLGPQCRCETLMHTVKAQGNDGSVGLHHHAEGRGSCRPDVIVCKHQTELSDFLDLL